MKKLYIFPPIFIFSLLIILLFPQSLGKYYDESYYDNAPYYKEAVISDSMQKVIKDKIRDKQLREQRAQDYKKEREEIRKTEEEKRIEEERKIEEKRRIEEERKFGEEKRIEEETIKENEEVKKENPGKMVSGIKIENPLIDVYELSAEDREIAQKIIDAINRGEKTYKVEDISDDHLMKIAQAIQDTYFYAWLDSDLAVGDNIVYIPDFTKENLIKCNYVTESIKRIGDSLKGLSEKEAVRRLNDYIRNNHTYEINTRDLYSLTHDKIGNCDSFSQFFEQVCDYIGIESKYVECRIIDVGDHACNKVKVDGVWYYIDVTFNQTYDNEYYLSQTLWPETHVYKQEGKNEWLYGP